MLFRSGYVVMVPFPFLHNLLLCVRIEVSAHVRQLMCMKIVKGVKGEISIRNFFIELIV